MYSGMYSPCPDELFALCNGLRGWKPVRGLGPLYLSTRAVEKELFALVACGTDVSLKSVGTLALGRARVVNFYALIDRSPVLAIKKACDFTLEAQTFVAQLKEQSGIWQREGFGALDFSPAEKTIFLRVMSKIAPVLFNMGFADAIPHAGQVSRLTASMANSLGGRPSNVLQAAIVGFLHDPKFHPVLDLEKQNLATHPVVASALAYLCLSDPHIKSLLRQYFRGNAGKVQAFIDGIADALAVNNDSRFVQMFVILPIFLKRISDVFGEAVADDLKVVMERRLESACKGTAPPAVPPHLHGCLGQITFDSGLRGINRATWTWALAEAGIADSRPLALFQRIISGRLGKITPEQVSALKAALCACSSLHLSVRVRGSDLMHHHQEVAAAGGKAAEALVIADPMMLSPHKVASVYKNAVLDRIASYVQSFDDNIRLLPRSVRRLGLEWQRAVYLSIIDAADRLNGTGLLHSFRDGMRSGNALADEIASLRSTILDSGTWGEFAQASGTPAESELVRRCLVALEEAYTDTVNQYRRVVYTHTCNPRHFFPVR